MIPGYSVGTTNPYPQKIDVVLLVGAKVTLALENWIVKVALVVKSQTMKGSDVIELKITRVGAADLDKPSA